MFKKWILPFVAFAGCFFFIGFFKKYHLPKIKAWALVEIEKQSEKHLPLRLWPKSVDLTLFPLGLVFYEVRVLPKSSISSELAPFTIEKVGASLSFLGSLKGEARIGQLEIEGADVTYIKKKSTQETPPEAPSDKKPNPLANVKWSILEKVPLDNLSLSKVNLNSKVEEQGLLTQIQGLNLDVEFHSQSLFVEVGAKKVRAKKTGADPIVDGSFTTEFLVEEDGIYVSSFKAQRNRSFIVGAGSLQGNLLQQKFTHYKAKLRSRLLLPEVKALADELFPEKQIPELKGSASLDLAIDYEVGKTPRFLYNVETKNVFIAGFEAGQVKASGEQKNELLTVDSLEVITSGGHAELKNTEFKINKKLEFSTVANVKRFDLQAFLASIQLGVIPVDLRAQGNLNCKGQGKPKFRLVCQGDLTGENLNASAGNEEDAFSIIDVPKFGASGSVTVDTKNVAYKAKIKVGDNSSGSSSGTINYQNGFKIDYNGQVDFGDISNLASLNPEGVVQVKGNTLGTSNYATINMQMDGKELWLYDYLLGDTKFQLRYKSGFLNFRKIRGQIGGSRYLGQVTVNLKDDRIFVDAESNFLDAEDAMAAFSRRVQLPFPVTGTGKLKTVVRGPLQFNLLSYDFDASMYRGTVAKESFDEIKFHVISKDGQVRSNNVYLTKGKGRAILKGRARPDGTIDAKVRGTNFRIEQSENLADLDINLAGHTDFEMTLGGHILKPDTNLKGRLRKVVISDSPTKDSNFELSFRPDRIDGSGNFAGDVVKTKFTFPLAPSAPFKLYMKSVNWDFTYLFSILNSTVNRTSYNTSLTSELDLSVPQSNMAKATGRFDISALKLNRGSTEMSLKKPASLAIRNGQIVAKNFNVVGDNSFIRVASKKGKKLALDIDGKFDMGLLTLLTPFLDELRGNLSLSLSLEGNINNPDLLGSAYVQNGHVKIKDFPHAFEELSTDALFNQNSVLINALKGKFADGKLTGAGKILFKGTENVAVDVNGQVTNAKLQVPQGFTSKGSGQFFVKGNWFPYIVGGDFQVNGGSVDKNLAVTGGNQKEIKPSTYLPQFLAKKEFEPVHLDLGIDVRKNIPVKISMPGLEIDTPVRGNIKVKGSPTDPTLNGRITTGTNGQVRFRANIFEIRNGQVDFKNSKADNPILNVDAESRVTAKSYVTADSAGTGTGDPPEVEEVEEQFDVKLLVQGPAANPIVNISSQPPLPEHELISLLTLGFISTEVQANASAGDDSRIRDTSFRLTSRYISEQLNKQLKNPLGVEFDVSTGVDDEDDNIVNTVTIKKQWNPKFGTSMSRSFGGSTSTESWKGQYRLNKNFSVIGSYETTESSTSSTNTDSDEEGNEIGLDLEYKVEFK